MFKIENAVYLNLPHRIDRQESIVRQMNLAHIPATRLNAFNFKDYSGLLKHCWGDNLTDRNKCAGQLGCQFSHIAALDMALKLKWSHVAVFEDDFVWTRVTDPKLVQSAIGSLVRLVGEWDVIAISLRVATNHSLYTNLSVPIGRKTSSLPIRIEQAYTTHGYLVNRHYIPAVLDAFRNCDVQQEYGVAIDTCWNTLQKTGRWFGLSPQLGTQAESFSDIENRNVSYNI